MNIVTRVLFAVVLLAIPAHAIPVTAGSIITLGGDPYCPINCEANGAHQGFAVDIAKAIFEPKGYTISYQVLPWTRAVALGKRGEISGIIGASPGKPGYTYPTQPTGTEKFVLAVRANNPFTYRSIASLKGKLIGTINGYEIGGDLGTFLTENINNHNAVDATSGDKAGELNVKKLISGRLDMVVDNEAGLLYRAKTLGLTDNLKIIDAGNNAAPIYIAFSSARPETAELIKIYDDGIAELRHSGRLADILATYGVKDWQ